MPDTEYRPHVSLAVYGGAEISHVAEVLRPCVADCLGMPLTLASMGFFVAEESPAFLAVVPTEQLLAVHRSVHEALQRVATDLWPYYMPDSLLPHCTLSLDSTDASAIMRAVEQVGLPIVACATEVHIVEVATGRSLRRLL